MIPLCCCFGELGARVERLLAGLAARAAEPTRLWVLPTCYGGEHGPDLDDVAERTRLRPTR